MSQKQSFNKTYRFMTYLGHAVSTFFILHSLLLLLTPTHDLVDLPAPNPLIPVLVLAGSLLVPFFTVTGLDKINPLDLLVYSITAFALLLALHFPSPLVSLGLGLGLMGLFSLDRQSQRTRPLFKRDLEAQIRFSAYFILLCSIFVRYAYLKLAGPDRVSLPEKYLLADFFKGPADDLYFFLALALGGLGLAVFVRAEETMTPERAKKILGLIFAAAVTLGTLGLAAYSLLRVALLQTPTYDFGLFAQMFENMRQGLGMVTTLERDRLLSHMAVHVSPIYYAMVPFYALFPYPETLQVLQVLVVASGLLPLGLLGKKFDLSKKWTLALSALYIGGPALVGASFYDLHENCFLAPLVLWAFYAAISEKPLGMALSVLLTLMVKEDAFLYPFAIGLYILFRGLRQGRAKKDLVLICLIYMLIPLLTFVGLVGFLNSRGTGAMTGRFQNLMAYDMGLLGVIMTALQNPGFVIANLFKSAKVYYLLTILLGLGFLPLRQRHPENFFLALPLIVMNLLSDYRYQHHLEFQYNYGSFALLVAMVFLSLGERPNSKASMRKTLHYLLAFGLAFSLTNTGSRLYRRTSPLVKMAINEGYQIQDTKAALKALPKDKRLLVHNFYTTPLSHVFDLYDLGHHHGGAFDPEVAYIVLPRHGGLFKAEEENLRVYLEAGFSEDPLYSTDTIQVLKNPN